uniref:Ycf36 n=1 Tax=Mallomonas splendens TaxID=52552 RepID=A0A3G2QZM4_9STRA|nr:ycf36 [Mallomonas splendens]AYO28586.1 ycf36 [Mallomonas splendens]
MKVFFLCPVPENQKPINEYIFFRALFFQNNFFNLFLRQNVKEKLKGKVFFLFCCFFSKFFFSKVIFSFEISSFFSFFFLFSLFLFFPFFLRVNQIRNNLNHARFFYEETSWYDGQVWEKPLSLIRNDRLLSTQKIEPIFHLFFNLLFLIVFLLFFSFSFL